MVDNAATTTVLISVIAAAVFVCIIYFCHTYLRPHLKRPLGRANSPLPQWQSTQVRPDPRLRDSLYALPSSDHVHPRNHATDSEMRKTRWSTNVYDLARPSTRVASYRHTRQFSLQCNLPPAPSLINLKLPLSSNGSFTSQRTPNGTLKRSTISDFSALAKQNQAAQRKPKRSTLNMSDLLALANEPSLSRAHNSLRRRSRSDSHLGSSRASMLAQSHTALTGEDDFYSLPYNPRSSATANLSESSLPLVNKRKSLTRHSSYASFAQAAMDANSSGPSSESGDTTRTPPPPVPPLPSLPLMPTQIV